MTDTLFPVTRVVHCRREEYDVYIGRPSRWGNQWSHLDPPPPDCFHVKNRKEAISRYREWIATQPDLLQDIPMLRGLRLGCWCAPQSCHGHVLAELADA